MHRLDCAQAENAERLLTDPEALQMLADPTVAAHRSNAPEPAEKLEVEMRSLDTYDRVFGVIDGGLGQGVA